MKARFIFNPISGRSGKNVRLLPKIKALITSRHVDADMVTTQGPGHATVLAKEAVAAGCDRVVAVGGDGTMNEVAQALLHTQTALALVPCGSGNGLALHLGLPLAPDLAMDLAVSAQGRVAVVDTGVVNGRPFFNAMGVGLDADVSAKFNKLTKRGLPSYAKTAFRSFMEARPQRCFITANGERVEVEALLISVANSDQYGNRALIAPGARVDDGELDLVAVRGVGILGAMELGIRLFAGNFDKARVVRRFRGSHFLIERPAPGLVHTDGETHEGPAAVVVQVLPRSLKIVIPAASRSVSPLPDHAPSGFALQLP